MKALILTLFFLALSCFGLYSALSKQDQLLTAMSGSIIGYLIAIAQKELSNLLNRK